MNRGVAIPFIFQAPYHLAMGLNPYDQLRATNLYTAQDFNLIRYAGGDVAPGLGFDHITIDIDPYCFGFKVIEIGASKTVVYDPDKLVSNAPNPSKASDMIQALNYYIDNATSRNMGVVLRLHPTFVSFDHYKKLYNTWMGNSGGTLTPPVVYDSIWMQQLASVPYGGEPGPNHVLSQFWDEFLDLVTTDTSQTTLIHAPVNKVFFYILDEPMMDMYAGTFKNPDDTNLTGWPWKDWFAATQVLRWKEIQREALKVCRAKKPTHKFIVSPALGYGQELDSDRQSWKNWCYIDGINAPWTPDFGSGWWREDMPTFGAAYTPQELGPAFSDTYVVYTAHQFNPWKYTHYEIASYYNAEIGFRYLKARDFTGLSSTLTTPYRPHWLNAEAVMSGRNVADNALDIQGVWNWLNSTPPIPVGNNAFHIYIPPFYWGSMGVKKRCLDGSHDGTFDGSCSMGHDVSPYEEDRGKWHNDVTKRAAGLGMGWTVYDWIGQTGVSSSLRLHEAIPNSPGRTIHQRPSNRQGISEIMRQALFGTYP